jgi:outer membrane protein assembly factor BamD
MMRCFAVLLGLVLVACGGSNNPAATPAPESQAASPVQVDSLWNEAMTHFRNGKWAKSSVMLERFLLEAPAADRRTVAAHFYLAETYFATGDQLRAAREFRRVSDEYSTDSLAAEALMRAGDAYADLWRRPELDPTYGQQALATYQEVLTRFPGSKIEPRARERVAFLENKFAEKSFKAALYYVRLKAYDSAILYLRDLLATYPRATVAPEALVRLVEAYKSIGYVEEVKETCGYFRTNHPNAHDIDRVCPADSLTVQPPGA